MFIRSKFITNSSSTSVVVYGIEFNADQFEELIRVLYRKYMDKFETEMTEYFYGDDLEDDPDLTLNEDSAVEMVFAEYDRVDKYLPESVRVECSPDGTYWLDFDLSLAGVVIDDKVVLEDFSAKEVLEVFDLARDSGIKNIFLQPDSWEDWG